MDLIKSIISWLLSFFGFKEPVYQTIKVIDNLPSALMRKTIYIVEDDGYQEQVAMLCPCGCKSILQMNLLPDERPCWKITSHKDGTISLYPSVWRKKDCYSHFWFKHGKVYWTKGTGTPFQNT